MAWRLPQILIAMLVVLVLGLVSVWFLEGRMGGATVPGLVLIEAPHAGMEALRSALAAAESVPAGKTDEDASDRAVLGNSQAGAGLFEPFGQPVLARLHKRGDTMVLYVPRNEVETINQGVDRPAWSSVLASRRPADTRAAERVSGMLSSRQDLTGFCIGLVLEPAEDVADVVVHLLSAMNRLPEYRRASLVLLGARQDTDPGRRAFLRIDRGPWKGDAAEDLTDLLEGGW
jgi:hypothetical protein